MQRGFYEENAHLPKFGKALNIMHYANSLIRSPRAKRVPIFCKLFKNWDFLSDFQVTNSWKSTCKWSKIYFRIYFQSLSLTR